MYLFERVCGKRGGGLVVDSMNFGETAIPKSVTFLEHTACCLFAINLI